MTLGERITLSRKRAGLSQEQLGEKLGVELPITDAVYDVCFAEGPQTGSEWHKLCMDRIAQLFSRDTKFEF